MALLTIYMFVSLQSSAWLVLALWCFSSVSCCPSSGPSTMDTPTGNHSNHTLTPCRYLHSSLLDRYSNTIYWHTMNLKASEVDVKSLQSYCRSSAEMQAKTGFIGSRYSFDLKTAVRLETPSKIYKTWSQSESLESSLAATSFSV